jgi:hypothetical protein
MVLNNHLIMLMDIYPNLLDKILTRYKVLDKYNLHLFKILILILINNHNKMVNKQTRIN